MLKKKNIFSDCNILLIKIVNKQAVCFCMVNNVKNITGKLHYTHVSVNLKSRARVSINNVKCSINNTDSVNHTNGEHIRHTLWSI